MNSFPLVALGLFVALLQQVPGCPLSRSSIPDPFDRGDAALPPLVDAAADAPMPATDASAGALTLTREVPPRSGILTADGALFHPVDRYCITVPRTVAESIRLNRIGLTVQGPNISTDAIGVRMETSSTFPRVAFRPFTTGGDHGEVTVPFDGNLIPPELEAGSRSCFQLEVRPTSVVETGDPLLFPRTGAVVRYGIGSIPSGSSHEGPEWNSYTGSMLIDLTGVRTGRAYRIRADATTTSDPFIIRRTEVRVTVVDRELPTDDPLSATPLTNGLPTPLIQWHLTSTPADAAVRQIPFSVHFHRDTAESRLQMTSLTLMRDGLPVDETVYALIDGRSGRELRHTTLGSPAIREEVQSLLIQFRDGHDERIVGEGTGYRLTAILQGGLHGDTVETAFWDPGNAFVTGTAENVTTPLIWGERRVGTFVVRDSSRHDDSRFDQGGLIWSDFLSDAASRSWTNGYLLQRLTSTIPRSF